METPEKKEPPKTRTYDEVLEDLGLPETATMPEIKVAIRKQLADLLKED